MSTQTTFDLSGLTRAIQVHDCGYQLALYADDAEVAIHDPEESAAPTQVLRGKPDIRRWLDELAASATQYEIRAATASPGEVSFTEECRYRDGTTVLLECTAEVHRGRISRAAVRIVHPAAAEVEPPPESSEPAASVGAGLGPELRSRPRSAAPSPTVRHLPGQFLG